MRQSRVDEGENGRSSTWPWRTRRRLMKSRNHITDQLGRFLPPRSHPVSKLTLAEIVNSVELPQEGIPDDPKRSNRGGNVHPGKG